MKDLLSRLQDAGPTISKICEISGLAGASIGILHQRKVIHTANFGYRDVAAQKAPDEHTQYQIASLSKLFTASAIGHFVADERIHWDDPVITFLPEYTHHDEAIRTQATMLDHLSQRTCLAQKSAIWLQDGSKMLLPKEELFPTFSYTEAVHPLRSEWLYSNWGYCVAAAVTEELSGKTWGEYRRISSTL